MLVELRVPPAQGGIHQHQEPDGTRWIAMASPPIRTAIVGVEGVRALFPLVRPESLYDLDVARTLTRKERLIVKRAALRYCNVVAPWLCPACPECECGLPPQTTLLDEHWRDGEE